MHSTSDLPPLEGLSALLVAARTGSFSAAAADMGLTHGTISRRIRQVETWLGASLFERHGRGVTLTPAGSRLVQRVEQAFELIGSDVERWRVPNGLHVVRLSVLPSFAKLWLLPRIQALQGNPISLRLELILEHKLADFNQADVAIRYGRGNWPGLTSELLFEEKLVPVASPDIASALGQSPTVRAIHAYPLLNDSDGGDWRAWLSAKGINYRPRSMDRRFEDYDLLLAAAKAGLGIALLRRPLGDVMLASGALLPLARRETRNSRALYLVTRPGQPKAGTALCLSRLRHASGAAHTCS